MISNKLISSVLLGFGIACTLLTLLLLLIIPILPLDDENVLRSFSPTPLLVSGGLFGLIFIGGLSIFTIVVMSKGGSVKYKK